MRHKTLRSVISALIAVCLVIGVLPVAVFADVVKPDLNLVSFGDSMTNGYGHDGYYQGATQVNGFRQNDLETTYPAMLAKKLESDYNVKWEALAISCMRTEDINFLLRYHSNWTEDPSTWGGSDVESWNTTVKSKWESTFVDNGNVIGDYFTWNEFVKNRFNDWKKVSSDEAGYPWVSNPTLAYANYFQNAVKNADVITLGTGDANFGVIMLQNITSLLTGTFGSGFKDAVPVREVLERRLPAELVPNALEILDKIDATVVPYLAVIGEEKAAKVLEIVEHTVVSFMFSYIDMLYAIDGLNNKDNLDVIMMGLMNTMDGVMIDLGDGNIFDVGALVDGITDVLSSYYFVLPVALQELNGDFENITFYIVPNAHHIEMQVSDMGSLDKVKSSNTIRERMIQEVSGMIFGLVREPLNTALTGTGLELPNWSMNDNTAYQYREKVEAYELLQADYEAWVNGGYKGLFASEGQSILANPNDALACAVYLAFERAIIANADNATLDLAGLMSLMGGTDGLAGMMDPIAGALNLDPSALTPNVTAAVSANAGNYIVTPNTTPNPVPPVPSEVTLLVDSNAENDDAARADGATYKTIQGALAKAQNGDTIKLVTDIATDGVVYISGATGTTKLTLDLNGKTLTSSYAESGRVAVEAQSNVDVTIQNGAIISTGTAATVFVKGGTGNNSKLTLVDVTVENKLAGAWYNVYVKDNSAPALVLKGATTLKGGSNLIGGNNTSVAVEDGIYNFNPTSYVDDDNFEVTGPYVPDQITLPPMFTVIELTNALNGALGTALVSDDAASLGGLLSLYARMIIGNGIGSHPNAAGHKTLFEEIKAVYPDKPAKVFLTEVVKDTAEALYNYAKNGETDKLDEIVDFIAEKGYIDEAQAEVIKAQLPMIYVAVYEQNDEAALASCKKLAVMIYDYARANGYISDEVEEALIEAYKVYDELKDKTPEELKEIAKENIIALAEKYGPEVLEKVNEYILGLDVLDERQLGELEAKIAAYINEYYDDPEAGLEAAVNDIVDFVFEITEIDRDTVAAIYDYVTTTSKEEMIEDAAELLKEYLEAYGPAALEAVENYLISEGYVTADEIAAVTKQIGYAVAAYEAQDNAAVEASLNTLAKMVYDYADANGYIPAEVKEAVAAAIELYNKYGDLTPEEIKALVAAELQKFIAENKAAALIALETYIVNEGWMSEADLQELAQKIAAAIAAYEADPEGTTDKLVKELVDYVYAKAIEEGYIDPAQAEELVDLFNAAYEYYVNTPEEQIKADAINLLVSELDKHLEGKVDPEVYAQVKADIFALINYLETSTPEEIQADIDAFVADLVAKYEELIYNATHGKFIPNGESYYVALGSGTAYGLGIGRDDKGYFDLIVEALGLDAATQYKNLADPTLDTTKILEYIVKNAAEIQKADVITYQLDATAFVYAALSEEQPDWSKYFNTEDFAFIDEAIPVIKSILADDWTKYADIDAAQIVNDIKEQVLNSIDSAVMDAFKDQTDKLDELLSVCVAQVKSYVEYVQENAIELYKAILNDIARVNEAMAPVVEVINDNWASYADLEVEDIVDSVKDEVLAQLDGLKVLTKDKVNEIIAVIVEKAVALHNHVAEQIANIPGYFSEEQLAFAEVVYSYVADYVIANYPELTEIDVEGKVNAIHEKAYSEIMDILRSADEFNYEQYVELGADEIKEVLNTCEDIVMAAIDAVQDKAITALETVENAQAVVAEALDFIAEYLFTDWSSYVDMGVEEICNTIKDAFIAELAKQSAYGEQYVDEYADKITAVLTLCVEEVKAVLQNVQDVKEEALDIINTVEEYQTYINNVLYAAVAYAVDTAKAIEAIQTINPDAVLIVVGMYNPLDGFEVIVNNETINVGDYADYLIDATNVYYTALAIADGEFIFVPVPDTEINGFTTPIDTKLINVNQLGMLLLGLNTKMYANAAGNEYIYEQIMDAVDTSDYEPDVDNRTKEEGGEFDAKVEFDEYFRTAYVTCDQACVVLAAQTDEEGETTYTRLVPQALEDGTYGFDLTGIEGKYVLVVALKGDYNLDGAVTTNDVAQANKAFVNGTEPSALQNYVFDMTGDDEITTNDVAKVNKAIVNETAIEW